VDRCVFAAECRRHGIAVVSYPAEDLEAKVAALLMLIVADTSALRLAEEA
jgi:hypothetical protein